MKSILFKKRSDHERGKKVLTLCQRNEDQDCVTYVRKCFTYHVTTCDQENVQANQPQIYIRKSFNTKKRVEKFIFQVKGSFYMSHNRMLMEVKFQHTLNIRIMWKTKVFSPKKSAVLT